MYIHLGGDILVKLRDVIGIFNAEKGSRTNRAFLRNAEKKELILTPEGQEVKSFVVTKQGIYYSSISSATLKKRAQTHIE